MIGTETCHRRTHADERTHCSWRRRLVVSCASPRSWSRWVVRSVAHCDRQVMAHLASGGHEQMVRKPMPPPPHVHRANDVEAPHTVCRSHGTLRSKGRARGLRRRGSGCQGRSAACGRMWLRWPMQIDNHRRQTTVERSVQMNH